MTDKETKKDETVQVPTPLAFDPAPDPLAEIEHADDVRVVGGTEKKPVTRTATNAELGLPTTYEEDPLKFIPPVAPSNAPQPNTYVMGVRVNHEEEVKKAQEAQAARLSDLEKNSK